MKEDTTSYRMETISVPRKQYNNQPPPITIPLQIQSSFKINWTLFPWLSPRTFSVHTLINHTHNFVITSKLNVLKTWSFKVLIWVKTWRKKINIQCIVFYWYDFDIKYIKKKINFGKVSNNILEMQITEFTFYSTSFNLAW